MAANTSNALAALERASRDVENAKEIYQLKLETRNLLIIEAFQDGFEQKDIVAAVGVSGVRVMTIVAEYLNRRAADSSL